MTDRDTIGPRLEVMDDDGTVRTIPMTGSILRIGRDPTVDLRFEDAHISRQHARIERHADGACYLVDTSRHQATYFNGRRLLESRPVGLRDGDRIRVGDHQMLFRCESQVLPVEQEYGSTILESIADLSSHHLARRARRPAEMLMAVLNVNRALGGGGDLDEVLGRALGRLMDLFPNTECGVIVTAEADGQLPVRSIRHRGGPPPKLTLSRTILQHVLERGEGVLIRDVATDERFKGSESVATLFRTALCVPLPGSDGKPLGMVQLGASEHRGGAFTGEDLEWLAALAFPMAATVENDRLLRERAQWAAAREIQRGLLPRERPEIPGYAFWECYRPALEVGGDYYDYIRARRRDQGAEETWFFGLGDVTGKGMPAALLSAAVCPEIRHAVRGATSPADVLSMVNRHLCEVGFDTRFVTMLLAELDPLRDRLAVANAGHDRPLIRRADGRVEQVELPGTGLPLGVLAEESYEPTSLELAPGEVLVLHSDGLIDASDRRRVRFGVDRMMKTISESAGGAAAVGEALLEAVTRHSDGVAPYDDLTIVCLGREAT